MALAGRVADLNSISQGYLHIRIRFPDNYNKKVKREPAFQQTPAIENGNQGARGGEEVTDTILFRDQKCLEDPETYKELYGVNYLQAASYNQLQHNAQPQPSGTASLSHRHTRRYTELRRSSTVPSPICPNPSSDCHQSGPVVARE